MDSHLLKILLTISLVVCMATATATTTQRPLIPIDLSPTELFTAQYLSHRLIENVPAFHREWYQANDRKDWQYVCLEALRGGAKSTVMENCSLFNICEGEDDNVTLISRSGGTTGTATQIMGHVKQELESNELMIYDYGLRRGKYWGEDRLQVIRGDGHTVNFFSMGKRSSIRGKRGTVIIDDPQNRDDCESETVLKRDEEWFLTDVLPVVIKNQRLIFIGTPISPLSLLCKIKDMPDFKTLSFPARLPNGESIWPEQYSNEFLDQRERMMGVRRFRSEYMCEPMVSGNPVFQSEWFQHYEPGSAQFREKVLREIVYRVTSMDCAESKSDQADYTALVTIGQTHGSNPDYYIMDVRRDHWSTKEGAEQLFLVFDKYRQNKSRVESRVKGDASTGGDAMIEEIRDRERTYQKYMNLYPVRPTKDKVTRAMGIQSLCQEGRVYLNKYDKNHQMLLSELTMFTGSQNYHDDLVDAFVDALLDTKERGGSGGVTVKSGLDGTW